MAAVEDVGSAQALEDIVAASAREEICHPVPGHPVVSVAEISVLDGRAGRDHEVVAGEPARRAGTEVENGVVEDGGRVDDVAAGAVAQYATVGIDA